MVTLNTSLESYSTIEQFQLLPPGEYRVAIMNTEVKETRSGGSMLAMTYEVQDGERRGAKVFDNLNIWHSSPRAVEFALRQLKTIATCCGHSNPNYIADTSELHGQEMIVKLAIRKGDDGTEYQDVKGYKEIGNAQPGFQPAPAATPPAAPGSMPPPASGAKKPWE